MRTIQESIEELILSLRGENRVTPRRKDSGTFSTEMASKSKRKKIAETSRVDVRAVKKEPKPECSGIQCGIYFEFDSE